MMPAIKECRACTDTPAPLRASRPWPAPLTWRAELHVAVLDVLEIVWFVGMPFVGLAALMIWVGRWAIGLLS